MMLLSGCGTESGATDTATDTLQNTETTDTADGGSVADTLTQASQETTDKGPATDKAENNWSEDGALKILTIGNSFSDDTMQYVYQIAKDMGVSSISLGNLYIGGCTLNTHADNARGDKAAYEFRTNSTGVWNTTKSYKMSDAVKLENWDFISLQQASGSSGIESTYSQLGYLIKYVKELCPNAKIVWNMTWAYQKDSTHAEFSKYNKNQMTMYKAIVDTVDKKIKSNPDIYCVSATGTAIQNARSSYIGDRLTRDGYHLTYDFGRYVAGLTFFSALTEMSVENASYAPEGVDPNMRKVAIEAATNAQKSPFSPTASVYTTEPPTDYGNYTRLELNWTPLGYWISTSTANHHKIVTTASNSSQYYASAMLTKEDIPVGSIIELADGWQYRPEAWKSTSVQSSRPAVTSTNKIIVTEQWWGEYTHRAFNLSKKGTPALTGNASEIEGALTVWVPKK